MKIAVPKFQNFSLGIQLTTLLENRVLQSYFSRFLPTFKDHLFEGTSLFLGAWAWSRFLSIKGPILLDTNICSLKIVLLNF